MSSISITPAASAAASAVAGAHSARAIEAVLPATSPTARTGVRSCAARPVPTCSGPKLTAHNRRRSVFKICRLPVRPIAALYPVGSGAAGVRKNPWRASQATRIHGGETVFSVRTGQPIAAFAWKNKNAKWQLGSTASEGSRRNFTLARAAWFSIEPLVSSTRGDTRRSSAAVAGANFIIAQNYWRACTDDAQPVTAPAGRIRVAGKNTEPFDVRFGHDVLQQQRRE